jgi:adenosylhomocysteine nucleosidase
MKPKFLFVSATQLEHQEHHIFGNEIHIIGVGKVNAAVETSRLINKYDPDYVINFGSAGNLKDYKVGEVLMIGEVHNDIDVRPFAEYGYSPFNNRGPLKLQGKKETKCFTTDYFYDKSKNYLDGYLGKIKECDVIDMELYSIVQACNSHNKLCYSFKWISDDGDSSKWKENAKIGYENCKQYMSEMLFSEY